MRKVLLTLVAMICATVSYAGDGTKENPYTVAEVIAATMDSSVIYVKAYIVGSSTSSKASDFTSATGTSASASNIFLADGQDETDYTKCIAVQLPKGDVRTGLNLQDNPDNLGKTVLLQGQLIKYFGQNGIKNASSFELSGETKKTSNDFEAALTDAQGNWTFENVTIPEGLSYVWAQSTSYGMKASAYANSTKYATESYLVSPTIVLEADKTSVLTFDHVSRYAEDAVSDLTLWVREKGATTWASQLNIPTFSDGSSWTYVSSGDIDLSSYAGKTIQLGWRYTSTQDYAATWELKNVKVTNAAAEVAPTKIDTIVATAAQAYAAGAALESMASTEAYYNITAYVYSVGTDFASGTETFTLTDVKGEKGDSLVAYKASLSEAANPGAKVNIIGKITNYKGTIEICQGAKCTILENGEEVKKDTIEATAHEAYEACAALESGAYSDNYYKITAYVDSITYNYSNGTMSFTLTDVKGQKGDSLVVYKTYISEAALVGAKVCVTGKLQNYKGTVMEVASGSNTVILEQGEETAVQSVKAAATKADTIFDLAGRRVAKAEKGIYIINGKKVLK